MRPLPPGERRDDPFCAHFPELKTLLRDSSCGRTNNKLRRFVEDNSLMSEWDVDMRYAPAHDMTPQRVQRWRDQASALVEAMDG
jgi:hypothetical protein